MGAEKRFPPTAKKLRKAREEGDVAKSRELTSAVCLTIGLALLFRIRWGYGRLVALSSRAWSTEGWSGPVPSAGVQGDGTDVNQHNVIGLLVEAGSVVFSSLVPTLSVLFVTVLLVELAQVGMMFSARAITFQLSRMDIGAGMRRIFGTAEGGAPQVLEALVRLLAHLAVAVFVGGIFLPRILEGCSGSSWFDRGTGLAAAAVWGAGAAASLIGVSLVFGVLLLVRARHVRLRRLAMDAEELRRELRESEGDPELKALRRQAHQEFLLQGILGAVRRAKVVVRKER